MVPCSFIRLTLQSLVTTGLLLLMIVVSEAQVRSSSNYRLESDSVNFGGGLATSTNYSLESTAGEIATGPSDSATYSLRAGYQQMQEVFISLTAPADVIMTPNIGGITGGTANGSTSVLVLTDSPSGYALTLVAESAPAMQRFDGESIANYAPQAAPNTDPTFLTTASDAHFGFNPEGDDVVLRYLNNTTLCGVGSNSTALMCWDGVSTTPQTIASGAANQPSGATTTLYFRVGVGGSVVVPAGTYVATTTLTALPL